MSAKREESLKAEVNRLRRIIVECDCGCHETGASHQAIERQRNIMKSWLMWILRQEGISGESREWVKAALRCDKPPSGDYSPV